MPRPYGWIRGEGTVKNQRWGLGGIMDTPFIPSQHGFTGLGANCPGDPSCPGYVAPDSTDYILSLQNELATIYDAATGQPAAYVPATVINWPLIAGVALVGFLLLRR